jgi:hypothetical protein
LTACIKATYLHSEDRKGASGGQGDFLKKVPLEPPKTFGKISRLNFQRFCSVSAKQEPMWGPCPTSFAQKSSSDLKMTASNPSRGGAEEMEEF